MWYPIFASRHHHHRRIYYIFPALERIVVADRSRPVSCRDRLERGNDNDGDAITRPFRRRGNRNKWRDIIINDNYNNARVYIYIYIYTIKHDQSKRAPAIAAATTNRNARFTIIYIYTYICITQLDHYIGIYNNNGCGLCVWASLRGAHKQFVILSLAVWKPVTGKLRPCCFRWKCRPFRIVMKTRDSKQL